jgi:hypothetical protein
MTKITRAPADCGADSIRCNFQNTNAPPIGQYQKPAEGRSVDRLYQVAKRVTVIPGRAARREPGIHAFLTHRRLDSGFACCARAPE